MASRSQRRTLEQGARAPEFELKTLEGEKRSLGQITARGPALLAFFKVTCPVCQFTLPFLERLQKLAGGRLQIYAVSQDDAQDTREFHREFGITLPTLLDGRGYPASNAFGISSVPTSFVVEPDGKISAAVAGFSRQDLEALARRFGAEPLFEAGEYVPEWRAG